MQKLLILCLCITRVLPLCKFMDTHALTDPFPHIKACPRLNSELNSDAPNGIRRLLEQHLSDTISHVPSLVSESGFSNT